MVLITYECIKGSGEPVHQCNLKIAFAFLTRKVEEALMKDQIKTKVSNQIL